MRFLSLRRLFSSRIVALTLLALYGSAVVVGDGLHLLLPDGGHACCHDSSVSASCRASHGSAVACGASNQSVAPRCGHVCCHETHAHSGRPASDVHDDCTAGHASAHRLAAHAQCEGDEEPAPDNARVTFAGYQCVSRVPHDAHDCLICALLAQLRGQDAAASMEVDLLYLAVSHAELTTYAFVCEAPQHFESRGPPRREV
ncbi:MAG: hypothetical protein KDA61_04130 [Planctomycetales bacterium]|nr:hypothetical protein [Planctomycetales bacterium]